MSDPPPAASRVQSPADLPAATSVHAPSDAPGRSSLSAAASTLGPTTASKQPNRPRRPRRPRHWWPVVVIVGAAIWAYQGTLRGLGGSRPAAASLLREAWPPYGLNWNPTAAERVFLSNVLDGLVETVQIAVLATLIGFALSLPLAILATRTLLPLWVVAPARLLASAIRVLPSILWAIVMVMVLGFGPVAGVAAMSLYTMGYLAKLQYEAFEGIPRDAMDAVRAMGANRLQVAREAVLPEAGNALRSQALFMFEYNVRSSTIVGIVGAGGVGQLLSLYLKFFQYGRVFTILLLMFLLVVVIDAASLLVRRRFLELEGPRGRWRDLLGLRASARGQNPK
jgi:phosphonate transport system permease protein